MTPEFFARLVEGSIPLIGGVYGCLLGYRIVGKKPGVNLKYDEWHRRYGKLFQICGPLLILFGLSRIMCVPAGSDAPPANWQWYSTSDGVCSAEFPEPPKREKVMVFGIENDRLV